MYVKEFLSFIGGIYQIKGHQLTRRIEEVIELVGLQIEQKKKSVSFQKATVSV
jgi:ABC-2 type transport system ATP-binding protein